MKLLSRIYTGKGGSVLLLILSVFGLSLLPLRQASAQKGVQQPANPDQKGVQQLSKYPGLLPPFTPPGPVKPFTDVKSLTDLWGYLIQAKWQSRTIVLARVESIERQPDAVLAEFKKLRPDLDPMKSLPPRGGRFQILETLDGTPFTAKTADVLGRVGFFKIPRDGSPLPQTDMVYSVVVGQYWLLVYNNLTHQFETESMSGSIWISGLNDPLLQAFRQFTSWTSMEHRQAARVATASALDTHESTFFRYVGKYYLNIRFYRAKYVDAPDRPELAACRSELLHCVTQLLSTPSLDSKLQDTAIQAASAIDMSQEIKPGSDEALLIRYLLSVLAYCQDQEKQYRVAKTLTFLLDQADYSRERCVYYCPEILDALEKQEVANATLYPDKPNSISGVLKNLESAHVRHIEDITEWRVVVRTIPALGQSDVAQRLLKNATKP